eukprot:1705596-Amphidinium_carterae.1
MRVVRRNTATQRENAITKQSQEPLSCLVESRPRHTVRRSLPTARGHSFCEGCPAPMRKAWPQDPASQSGAW